MMKNNKSENRIWGRQTDLALLHTKIATAYGLAILPNLKVTGYELEGNTCVKRK
jgi:hypothetical protein